MDDSIQSIRYVPSIKKLNPKGKADNNKGKKEKKDDFSKLISDNDKEMQSREDNQVNEENETTLQEKADDDFDTNCGIMLDTEI
ncbi:permease [Candidatus Scalindua japonica]|uniref:Permease n=1 Tax=Candidatus Scalindua japonica TaxID=1284222 RepID=A0A286TVW1_9BACT|nr:hypothetical protein [Candidatus Scalindua japonica]GAX60027.1 permease [Candidatus Scalindua japonica]